jgi:pimeloyl-ACP methyl ester carboxylesterase
MHIVTSADGTTIAFEQIGAGPTLILVDGALNYRAFDQGAGQLAELLASHFTVVRYDRRGRGDSTDTPPYAVAREIDDLDALITVTGGTAFLYGISSGAILAMEAAIALPGKVAKLAMYEAPCNDDPAAQEVWKAYSTDLGALLAAGRRGDAVARFMSLAGAPAHAIDEMRQAPVWQVFEAVAPTLAYDHIAILGDTAAIPSARATQVAVPALIMDGDASYPFMHPTALALARAMPHGQHRTLAGQTHEVAAEAMAPVLLEFFMAK